MLPSWCSTVRRALVIALIIITALSATAMAVARSNPRASHTRHARVAAKHRRHQKAGHRHHKSKRCEAANRRHGQKRRHHAAKHRRRAQAKRRVKCVAKHRRHKKPTSSGKNPPSSVPPSTTPPAAPPVKVVPVASVPCTTTLSPGANVGGAVASAPNGAGICLRTGSYSQINVSNANHTSYVTVEPAPGATPTVDGVQISNSAFLRFQQLKMTEGFNVIRTGHDFQFLSNNIGPARYGVVLDGYPGPITNVVIQGNLIHNLDFSGSSSGYAGGQGVTLYWGADVVVSHNHFWANSWHYIQCGGCDGLDVDHNLFSCPCNGHSGAHLNILQIWQGGSNDSFTNNIIDGSAGPTPICGGCVLLENGAGGATCSETFSNYNISNNLFVDAGGSLPIQLQTTNRGTVSHNTVADGFQYGIAVGYNSTCTNASTNLSAQYNIVAGQTGNGTAYRYGCDSGCVNDHNVADSHGGTSGTGSMNGWTQHWQTTSWNPMSNSPAPSGFYKPVGISSAYGYQGAIGP